MAAVVYVVVGMPKHCRNQLSRNKVSQYNSSISLSYHLKQLYVTITNRALLVEGECGRHVLTCFKGKAAHV